MNFTDEIHAALLVDDRVWRLHTLYLEKMFMGHENRAMLHANQRAALKGHLCIAKDGLSEYYKGTGGVRNAFP